MSFNCYDVALELVRPLKAPIEALRRSDRSLAEQAQRAAQSIVLNLAEGRKRAGRDRKQHFRIALGSAGEVGAAIDLALAWSYVASEELARACELLDRVIAMLWRLCE